MGVTVRQLVSPHFLFPVVVVVVSETWIRTDETTKISLLVYFRLLRMYRK